MRSSCHSAAAEHARGSQSILLYLGKSLNNRSDKMDLSSDSMRDNTKVGLSDKETRIEGTAHIERFRKQANDYTKHYNFSHLDGWPDSHCPCLEEVTGQHRRLSRK